MVAFLLMIGTYSTAAASRVAMASVLCAGKTGMATRGKACAWRGLDV